MSLLVFDCEWVHPEWVKSTISTRGEPNDGDKPWKEKGGVVAECPGGRGLLFDRLGN
jgi:hypothetical protein